MLAAWMAAGWLVDGLAGAGWLTGRPRGPQDPGTPPIGRAKAHPGALNQPDSLLKNTSYKAVSCKTARLHRLQGYMLKQYAPQPGGPKGPADDGKRWDSLRPRWTLHFHWFFMK